MDKTNFLKLPVGSQEFSKVYPSRKHRQNFQIQNPQLESFFDKIQRQQVRHSLNQLQLSVGDLQRIAWESEHQMQQQMIKKGPAV